MADTAQLALAELDKLMAELQVQISKANWYEAERVAANITICLHTLNSA